jgi:hypothetical protein
MASGIPIYCTAVVLTHIKYQQLFLPLGVGYPFTNLKGTD